MVQYIGKINKDIFDKIFSDDIATDDVIITDDRVKHIIERRGLAFYDEYEKYFADIICSPDYVFKDRHEKTVIVSKTFPSSNITINLVIRLAFKSENSEYKNSIITAIQENDKRFKQRIRNGDIIYKRID